MGVLIPILSLIFINRMSMINEREYKEKSKIFANIRDLSKTYNIDEYTLFKFCSNPKADDFIQDTETQELSLKEIKSKIKQIAEDTN